MLIKEKLKALWFGPTYSSEAYIDYLRSLGMKIGEDVTIYSPRKTLIDKQYPWMISIGNHVRITEGVILLTHDYSWSVLKRIHPENDFPGAIMGASGKIDIGDNVFIGMRAIVLRGVRIGDNVIIGAGSVVTKDCNSGYVYAGNPARKVCSTEDFYLKRKELQIKEAKELAYSYFERFGKRPPKEIFHEYFFLFQNSNNLPEIYRKKLELCMNFDQSIAYLKKCKPVYDGFDSFIDSIFSSKSD